MTTETGRVTDPGQMSPEWQRAQDALAAGERWIEYRAHVDLPPALRNPKRHDRDGIRASLKRFGFTSGVLLDERTGRLVAGHGRADVVHEMEQEGEEPPRGIRVGDDGVWLLPVQRGWSSVNDDEAEAYLLADNRLTESGGWDEGEYLESLQRLAAVDESLLVASGHSREDVEDLLRRLSDLGDRGDRPDTPTLADRFLIPPFDVLDARQGWWRDRKKQWLGLGIRSEIGRAAGKPHPAHEEPGKGRDAYLSAGGNTGPDAVNAKGKRRETRPEALLLKSDSGRDSDYYRKKQAVEARLGRELTTEEFQRDYYTPGPGNGGVSDSGTSVFDPVLCELAYRWYCPEGGLVLDPFAGGSVRGIVGGLLGRRYRGVDLSVEQIAANEAQREAIAPLADVEWLVGDARTDLPDDVTADAVLTCPPYASLERYSDDPRDLSTMSMQDFGAAVRQVLSGCYERQAEDSFAVWVLGHVRVGRQQHDLAALIEGAALDVGYRLHNRAVLITPIGSLAVRAPRQFLATRVLGRTYQDVVVLVRGDARVATERCGKIEVADPAEFGVDADPIEGTDLRDEAE